MTTETRCDSTPFPDGGQNLDALYFTKAPGEEYLRVYAQYNNDPCWVPLPVMLPAFPDLQQVRDAGRNISIASGSYEDAHFYLRSADGNNMTAAYFTNAAGGGIQVGNAANYAPLNLQPNGGLLTYGGAEVATKSWAQQYALTRKNDVVANFNTVTTAGIYTINSGLTAIPNYPHIGNNNNGATAGYLVVYQNGGNAGQFFYPTNESATLNRGGGYWYRRTATDVWEYKNGVLDIRCGVNPVHADALEISGDYLISGLRSAIIAQGYPDPGTDIPLMLTVRKRWGNVSNNYAISQEAVSLQESGSNFTRKWIRSRFNWRGNNPWDAWNQVGLLRDVYSKAQLNTSGAGGAVHWDNVSNKPAIVSTETDPTVPAHVKGIAQASIDSWNAKENAANKSAAATLGSSDTLFPTQKAVKTYVDTAITSNNAGYIPVGQKGTASGVASLDSNGKIPDAQLPAIANWWDYNSYPANWVAPRNTDGGPAVGIETGGGLATQGITTLDTSRTVKKDDLTLIFSKTATLDLPDPTEYPGRMLRLRVRKGEKILFRNFNIYDIDSGSALPEFIGCDDGCGISRGHTVDLQSIQDESGAWRWFITAMTR